MTEEIDLPRRTVLGALGAVGVGSAAGGLGTSAFFSDTESFQGNSLTAGELDLKVDWTEHYFDGSSDETQGVSTGTGPGAGLTGFPSTAPVDQKMVFVDDADTDTFMDNTAIEAFPDVLDPENEDYDALQATIDGDPIDDEICDLDADLDSVLSSSLRTRGTFPSGGQGNAQKTEAGDSLVDISDIKPGDFGEVTFSFHLCGNPGWVWLTGALQDASENGETEPEGESPDEIDDSDPDVDGEYVELLDEIRAAVWYDTGPNGVYEADAANKEDGEGDNVFGTGEVLIPLHGSLRSVLRALEGGRFPLDAEPISSGDSNGGAGSGGNGTPEITGVVEEDDDYVKDIIITNQDDDRFGGRKNYSCAAYESNLDYFESGDLVGSEVLNPEDASIVVGNRYSGCTTLTVNGFDDSQGEITLSSSSPVQIVSVKGGNEGENVYVFTEPVILNGATFTTPTNQNISNVDVCCPADGDHDQVPPAETGRQCFPNSTTAYIGFEWWLPTDVGNEVQGDSVSFDIGFYTEQCRHNENPGSSQ